MPTKKKASAKLRDLKPKSVSAAKAANTKGGRDSVSGNATGRRAYKPAN